MPEFTRMFVHGCFVFLLLAAAGEARAAAQAPASLEWNGSPVALFPTTHPRDPGLPSPYRAPDGTVTLTARLADGRVAIVAVTLTPEQRTVDAADFPALARTGLHDENALAGTRTITGRSVAEITFLARPGRLSTSGFMTADEDIVSVLSADNRLVARLGLTHRALAEPLAHVMNLLATDIGVVWANHSFDGLAGYSYNGREIRIRGTATKGGQESIFADGIGGAIDLDISRGLDEKETTFLKSAYGSLPEDRSKALVRGLSQLHTGEMEPQYITRYGFYEGHTEYRTDPLAIAFVFGLRTIEEIEAAFPGKLPEVLVQRFTRERVKPAGSEGDAAPPAAGAQAIDRLIARLEFREWEKAADEIMEIGEPAIPRLIAAMNDSAVSRWISERAVYALGRFECDEIGGALVAATQNGALDVRVRAAAAEVLGAIGCGRAADPLLDIVKDSSGPPWLRSRAAISLGRLKDRRAVGPLIDLLKSGDQAAAEALGRIGSAEAAEPLIRALGALANWYLARESARAVVAIGGPAVGPLSSRLASADPEARWQAANLLAQIGHPDAVKPLVDALADLDWRVRNEAAVALAKIGSRRTLPLLREKVRNADATVRAEARWVMREIASR